MRHFEPSAILSILAVAFYLRISKIIVDISHCLRHDLLARLVNFLGLRLGEITKVGAMLRPQICESVFLGDVVLVHTPRLHPQPVSSSFGMLFSLFL